MDTRTRTRRGGPRLVQLPLFPELGGTVPLTPCAMSAGAFLTPPSSSAAATASPPSREASPGTPPPVPIAAPALPFDSPDDGVGVAPPLDPLFKWAGGKKGLVPTIRPLLDRHRDRVFVEPFCGGAAESLAMRPDRAILNDINPSLIAVFRAVQTRRSLSVPDLSDKPTYLVASQRFNKLLAARQGDSDEAATLFLALNTHCFNGMFRASTRRGFNVPHGGRRPPKAWPPPDAADYQRTFAGWTFTCGDFASVTVPPDAVLILDPPYGKFTHYTPGGFSWSEQVRVARWAAQHEGPCIAHNTYDARTCDLWRGHGFDVRRIEAPRRISCDGNREAAAEMLATRML